MKLFLLLILSLNTGVAGLPPTTLKGQGQSTATTTFNFQVPAKQATKTSTGTLIETGNANILSNSDFEHTTVSTDVTTSGSGIVLSAETTNVISGLQSLKMALTSSTNAQAILESTANSQWSGVQATASCKIKTSLSGIKFCSISGGVEDNCLDVSNANTWQDYLIPTVASSSSTNGLKVKVGSGTLTGDVYIDGCKYESARIGTLLACPDPVKCAVRYEAELNGTSGTITKEPIDWLTSVVRNSAGNYTVNFNSGIFTQTPFCAVTNTDGGNFTTDNNGTISTTQWGFRTFNASTGAATDNARVTIQCFKNGTDYTNALALTSSVSASNQDYDWTAYTPSFNAFGTPTSVECFHKRQGSDLLLSCKFIAGATTGGTALVYFPNNLVASSSLPSVVTVGSASNYNTQTILTGSGANYVGFGNGANGVSVSLSYRSASSFVNSGDPVSFYARIPIQGWNTPNQVIATVKDNVQMSVANGKPKMCAFKADYDGGCSIVDQVGACAVDCTRNALGTFTVDFVSSYWTKVHCTGTSLASPEMVSFNSLSTSSYQYEVNTHAGAKADDDSEWVCVGY